MTRSYNLTSTKINLGAPKCLRHLDAPKGSGFVENSLRSEKKRRSRGVDRRFCVFLPSHAVLAKTVLASRRSRAAVGGICFSADQLVPRITLPLPFGNEHCVHCHRVQIRRALSLIRVVSFRPDALPPFVFRSTTGSDSLLAAGEIVTRCALMAVPDDDTAQKLRTFLPDEPRDRCISYLAPPAPRSRHDAMCAPSIAISRQRWNG